MRRCTHRPPTLTAALKCRIMTGDPAADADPAREVRRAPLCRGEELRQCRSHPAEPGRLPSVTEKSYGSAGATHRSPAEKEGSAGKKPYGNCATCWGMLASAYRRSPSVLVSAAPPRSSSNTRAGVTSEPGMWHAPRWARAAKELGCTAPE